MPRRPRFTRRAVCAAICGLALLALLLPNFGGARAQSSISEPLTLPGDTAPAPAAGVQEHQQVAKGDDTYLAVWTDSRTKININEAGTRSATGVTGNGSQKDIYAARLNAAGEVIDTTPIVVDQDGNDQTYPFVGWNGQNWLVVWNAQKGNDYYGYEIRAARISPAGQLLDPTPIVLKADANSGNFPFTVIEDGAGNWVVLWEEFLPQEGTSIPRGAVVTKVSNDGAVLAPGTRVIYNHHSQYMSDAKIARAGDRYLLTFINSGPPYLLQGLTYDLNFNQLRTGPETLSQSASGYDLAANDTTWFVSWSDGASGNIQSIYGTRVTREGDPADVPAVVISNNVGTSGTKTAACWDGQYWFVAYSSSYNPVTQSYINDTDVYVARVTSAGQPLDPHSIPVKVAPDSQLYPTIAPGIGGGAQIAWQELTRFDLGTARVSRAGVTSEDASFALGAPRQAEVRMATNGTGFLVVFRDEHSGVSRIMGQRLDAAGAPLDPQPFVIADGAQNNNPSVGWNGSDYLVVWDDITPRTTGDGRTTSSQTFGRFVPASGAPTAPEFYIMDGDSPDAAGLNGAFLVVNIISKTSQIRKTQVVRVSGTGAPVGAPVEIEGIFNFWPRVVAYGTRWFAVWEYRANHNSASGTIRGAFIEQNGTVQTPFNVGDAGNDRTPHLAVAGNTALVVWSTDDIYGRRINPDGSSPDALSGAPLVGSAGVQARPAVAWDGNQYVLDWIDHRHEQFPLQAKGDIYGARVSTTNVKLEEFVIANSSLPEETPFVITLNGLSVFAYARFYPAAPFASHHITLRTARFPVPETPGLPAAPANLVATQVNQGLGTVTLTWTDTSANETGFKIESLSSTGTWGQVRLVGANITTADGFSVGTSTATSFRVRAYNAAGDSAYSNEASAPVIHLTPFSPTIYNEPATVNVAATASDPQGIARVEFSYTTDAAYPNYTPLATDTTAPYDYNWTNVPRGYYYVKAKAIDAQGSTTETLYESFVVRANPTSTITAPAGGATFQPGANIQISATAQTSNNDSSEYFTRMDFYANSTLVGTVQGNYATYNFTWSNVPTGNYNLTARPTSSYGLTGTSAPVNITVGNAGVNITGRVTDGAGGLYGIKLTLGGAQTATAFTDAAGNFAFTNIPAGGTYTVTPTATGYIFAPASLTFSNLSGAPTANFTGTPGAPIQIDPNAAPIYRQVSDGRGTEGPSSKKPTGTQVDGEMADDFDMSASITRIRAYGGWAYGSVGVQSNPAIYGIFVRFYDGASGAPGALQAEYYFPKNSPGFMRDSASTSVFDITLPTPFNAAGKHFIAVQPVSDENVWWPVSANYPNVRGAVWHKRDNLAGGLWSPLGSFWALDMAFDLYGTLVSTPRIDGFTETSVARSGLLHINGAFFGTTTAPERLKIDGKQSPFIPYWSDNLIIAHVPENATVGNVAVEVSSATGTSSKTIDVTMRQPQGRIRWRAEAAGDYASFRPAVAPPGSPGAGSVYVATNAGYLYAWSSDGALKWVAPGADGGSGPVSIGPDGTIYAASTVTDPNTRQVGPGIAAFNPDGTRKWTFGDPTGQSVRAGPNVGPDGKIYFVFRPTSTTGLNLGAVRPDGTLAWNVNRNFYTYGQTGKELTFGRLLPNVYFAFNSDSDPDPTLSGGLFAYNFDGQLVWQRGGLCCGVPTTAPDEDLRYADIRLNALNGSTVYDFNFPPFGGAPDGVAEAGPDNVHYIKEGSRLWAINPNGTEKWKFDPLNPDGSYVSIGSPVVNPPNKTILLGGGAFGQESLFLAVDPATGQERWRQLIPRTPGYEPYGNVFLGERAVFTPDGNTGYLAGDLNGDQSQVFQQKFLYFYALDTSTADVPINQRPTVTFTSPLDGANYPKSATINLTAEAHDDQPIAAVEFYTQVGFSEPRTLIATDTTVPYTTTFDVNRVGGYAFIAVVRDAGGLVGEHRINILTPNESPRVMWVSPADGAHFPPGATITLKASASDSDGTITKVDFYSSGSNGIIGTDTTPDAEGTYTVDWANVPVGTHTVSARAHDNDDYDISVTLTIDVDATPPPTPTPSPTPTPIPGHPTVAITYPADNASFPPGTNVTLVADAQDAADGTIARVDFFHAPFGIHLGTDFNPPYNITVGSGVPDVKQLYAVATDNAGNATRSATIRVIWEELNGTLSIRGVIRHEQSAPGNTIYLPNALVELTLHNNLIRTTRTDANGFYLFDRLSRGGEYGVRAAEPGYTFYPPSVIYGGLVNDETFDFVAEGPLPPGPTPTPTPGAGVLDWEKTYDSPYKLADFDTHVAVDAQGNTYVTGASNVPGGRGDTDISTVKYSPTGDQLWAKTFVGFGNYKDWPTDIKADAQGNVYIAGTTWRGSAYSYDFVTIKYGTDGTEQWVRHHNGPLGGSDFANALALDASGNIVVTGYDRSRDPFTGKIFDQFATVKYGTDGAELWVRQRSQAQSGDHAIDVAVDGSGNVYVTGFAWLTANGTQTKDILTVKYSSGGEELWAARHDGRPGAPGPQPLPSNPIEDSPGGIGIDATGNVYVFGSSVPGTAEDDFLLLRYNPDTGALVWGRNWSGPAYDYARDMAIDGDGNVYLTGETYDIVFQTVNDNPSSDAATVKFDAAGNLLWERVYRAFPGKWDGAYRIVLDAAGNAYVGAYSEGFFNSDTAVVKYQPDGTEAWVYRYDNPNHSSDNLHDMTADEAGNLYLTGHALIRNATGSETTDFVTFKLAASSVTLNSPPDITLDIGPTIAGNPVAADGTNTNGPTIAGRSIRLTATAFDRDGTVARVDFFDSSQFIGSDTTAPYEYSWQNPSEGTHAVSAMATDNVGATRATPTVAVMVDPAPPAYQIAGRIIKDGAPLAGVTLALSGAATATTTSNASGNYSFESVPGGGNYTITPTMSGNTFTPSNRVISGLGANQTADFVATTATAPPPPPAGSVNVALAANGGVVSASSHYAANFPASAANDGDRFHLYRSDGRYNLWHSAAGAAKPDWLEVAFAGSKTVTEIDLITMQDDYHNAVEPSIEMASVSYGIRSFEVQYWTGAGWASVTGGSITGNTKVWRKVGFAAVTTTRMRVLVHETVDGFSRIVELQAWGTSAETPPPPGRVNFALSANGATATASSQYDANFPATAAINGDRYRLYMPDGRYNIWHSAAGATKPDRLRIDFAAVRVIDEINVITQQDDYANAVNPTEDTTFTQYGIDTFEVQYWNGSAWATVPGGNVTGSNKVWRKFVFSPITTGSIRVLVRSTADGFSRIWEVEAWGNNETAPPPPPAGSVNVALAANGGVVSASSHYAANFPASAANDGDRFHLYRSDGRYNLWHSAAGAAKPDWLEVAFAGSKTVTEIDLITMQDDYHNAVEPSIEMASVSYGIRSFEVQYWTGAGWASVTGGSITGNTKVWRKVGFAAVTTTRMRVLVHETVDGFSRIVELQAWGTDPQ